DAADQTEYGVIVALALMTGLRQGELLGLRWQDVDFNNSALRVRQALQWLPQLYGHRRRVSSHAAGHTAAGVPSRRVRVVQDQRSRRRLGLLEVRLRLTRMLVPRLRRNAVGEKRWECSGSPSGLHRPGCG